MKIRAAQTNDYQQIAALLQAAKLPVDGVCEHQCSRRRRPNHRRGGIGNLWAGCAFAFDGGRRKKTRARPWRTAVPDYFERSKASETHESLLANGNRGSIFCKKGLRTYRSCNGDKSCSAIGRIYFGLSGFCGMHAFAGFSGVKNYSLFCASIKRMNSASSEVPFCRHVCHSLRCHSASF